MINHAILSLMFYFANNVSFSINAQMMNSTIPTPYVVIAFNPAKIEVRKNDKTPCPSFDLRRHDK